MERLYWHLGDYHYVYYGFIVKQLIQMGNPGFVLDAGCGKEVRIFGPVKHLVSVDVSRSNVVAIRCIKEGDFVVGSLTNLPFRPEVFDTVVCVDVIEHVKGKENAFSEIARVSKQGAHFVGSTTNQLNPLMLLDELLPFLSRGIVKYAGEFYDRHSRLNIRTLTEIMKGSGFRVSVSLVGFPQFQPWLYEYGNKKAPWFSPIW